MIYKIIKELETDDLDRIVNEHLIKGWVLYGHLSAVTVAGIQRVNFMQAMTYDTTRLGALRAELATKIKNKNLDTGWLDNAIAEIEGNIR